MAERTELGVHAGRKASLSNRGVARARFDSKRFTPAAWKARERLQREGLGPNYRGFQVVQNIGDVDRLRSETMDGQQALQEKAPEDKE